MKQSTDEEAERLRTELAEVRRLHCALQDEIRGWSPTKLLVQIDELTAERDVLKAAIKRVREICEGDKTAKDAYDLAADILIALDA